MKTWDLPFDVRKLQRHHATSIAFWWDSAQDVTLAIDPITKPFPAGNKCLQYQIGRSLPWRRVGSCTMRGRKLSSVKCFNDREEKCSRLRCRLRLSPVPWPPLFKFSPAGQATAKHTCSSMYRKIIVTKHLSDLRQKSGSNQRLQPRA